jgi:hypothetical protein
MIHKTKNCQLWQEILILPLPKASRVAVGPTQPPIQRIPRTLLLDVKQAGCKADHSPVSGAEIMNEWSYISAPPYAFKMCTWQTSSLPFITT